MKSGGRTFDIKGICETFLKTQSDNALQIDGYCFE